MATLQEIQDLLDIEIGDKRLRPGKRIPEKNRYYYYENSYYIVELTQGKWVICEDCRTTRKLLRKYSWRVAPHGYALTNIERTTKCWHQLYLKYRKGLIADHINNKRFDNRHENLRVTTYAGNMRNKTKRTDNTSGKQGVSRAKQKKNGHTYHYWDARIVDNDGRVKVKLFSIDKLGDAEAKRQSIAWRRQKEQEFGYIGD